MARRWWLCPLAVGAPVVEPDAERRAEQRRLDVVRGERVAREEHVDPPARDEPLEVHGRRPVWMIAGPPTNRIFRPACRISAMPRATAATLSSFGRSAETSLDMKPKTCAGSLRGAGTTFTARSSDEHAVARAHAVTGVQTACGPSAGLPAPRRSPSRCARRAATGRHARTNSGGWSSSRTRAGKTPSAGAGTHRASCAGEVAPSWPSSWRMCCRASASGARTTISAWLGSSRVVPMRNR